MEQNTTQWLNEIAAGDRRHVDLLASRVYDELRQMAGRQLAGKSPNHLIQPTALVHEAFLRLVNQREVDWQGRTHFLAISSKMMRRVLVDTARRELRQKRGGGRTRIPLSEAMTVSPRNDVDVLAVDEAIEKLAELDPLQAQIVELRFFSGMSVEEVAEVIGQSKRTVERQWTAIRAWLRRELAERNHA